MTLNSTTNQQRLQTLRMSVIIQAVINGNPSLDLTRERLLSKERTEPLATIRQEAMFLCRYLASASFGDISLAFERKNKGTANHAARAIPEKLDLLPSKAILVLSQKYNLNLDEFAK